MWSVRRYRLPFGVEAIPGIGDVAGLGSEGRWRLAGEYVVTHKLVGPWYRKTCVACGTRGKCAYGRWATAVLAEEVRREWCL